MAFDLNNVTDAQKEQLGKLAEARFGLNLLNAAALVAESRSEGKNTDDPDWTQKDGEGKLHHYLRVGYEGPGGVIPQIGPASDLVYKIVEGDWRELVQTAILAGA